jgi:hypothetical protein
VICGYGHDAKLPRDPYSLIQYNLVEKQDDCRANGKQQKNMEIWIEQQ